MSRHVHRYSPARRPNRGLFGFGCVFITGLLSITAFLVLYLTGALMPLVFGVLGVERVGDTRDLFDERAIRPTLAVPDPVTPPRQVVVDLGRLGQQTVNIESREYQIVTGASAEAATATFSEAALMAICRERSPVCRSGDGQFRNIDIDLRPGGAVVYADAFTGFGWQRAGIVLQVEPTTGTSFTVTGVDVMGTTYSPHSLPFGLGDVLGELVIEIEREGNAMLRDLAIQAGGDRYRLHSISVDERYLTLNLRGR